MNYYKITLPHINFHFHFTKINFVENQLSLTLISLSPLITDHLRILQHSRVRSYFNTNLPMIRSVSFGSNKYDFVFRSHYAFLK